MKETVDELVRRVRVALDELPGVEVDSDFSIGMDLEIEHALLTASTELSEELPDVYLLPKTLSEAVGTPEDQQIPAAHHITNTDGTGTLMLPEDFLRLVRLRLSSWQQDVREITDPNSNEARMQVSPWTRGTPQKPKVILGPSWKYSGKYYRELKYFTAGKDAQEPPQFDHTVWRFSYLPMPVIVTDQTQTPPVKYLETGLNNRSIPLIVYRACAIVLEGKQNSGLADRFRAMSSLGN